MRATVIPRAAVAVLVGLAVLVGACATPVSGAALPAQPVAAPPGGGLPLDPEQQRDAELFAHVRSWDMCAMHDVAAAARVTGFDPDELLPYRELGICRLVMKQRGGAAQWELTLDVFRLVPTPGGSPIEAGGAELQQVRESDDVQCAYSLPIGDPDEKRWGIEVSVYSVSANKPPCDVAGEYATAIAPRMADPPLRSAGLTTPALDLAASDPCALAAAMVPALSGGLPPDAVGVAVGGMEPFGCDVTVTARGASGSQGVRGSVALTLESAGDVGGDAVAGFPAARDELGNVCKVVFAPSDVVLAGNPGMPPDVPAVEVAGDCGHVDGLAEAAAGVLVPAPRGAPPGPPLALGDLNPPPTVESAGAPFDPCTVVGWPDYPAGVRPATPRQPVPMPVGPDDPFAVGCKFNAGDMHSLLVWGMADQTFSADPAARPGAVPARFGGRPGAEELGTNESNDAPDCYSAVQLSRGIAAMSTTTSGDPCAVNRAVLDQVAQRVP
ncbi:hypothetical protein [Pseudonocardia sp. DLS-67]